MNPPKKKQLRNVVNVLILESRKYRLLRGSFLRRLIFLFTGWVRVPKRTTPQVPPIAPKEGGLV